MLVRLILCVAFLEVFACPAFAATPSVEELHQLVLAQQQQIEAQNSRIVAQDHRLNALEQELADQRLLVMAQQRQIFAQKEHDLEQQRQVENLTQSAVDARTELDLVQAAMASASMGVTASQGDGNPYMANAGPMTASLEPAGTAEEPPLPYALTAGVEYLIASSDSFRFYSFNIPNSSRSSSNTDGRAFSPGLWIDFAYQPASGITWGAGLHYWSEDGTTRTVDGDLYVDITADPFGADSLKATMNAERLYGDLYGQGNLASTADLRLDILAGLRAGMFNQSILVQDADDLDLWSRGEADYWGLGPRIGLALDWDAWDALGVVADANLALLIGQSTAISDNDGFSGFYAENTQFLDTAWMFDSRLGLEYLAALAKTRLAFELGLTAEYWAGLPNFPRYEDLNANARYGTTDMLLIGPYFDVRWDF